MNKTVTINISGIVFHIDEAAYEKLKNYLNTIGNYFKSTEGGDEIMSDIQARIAEMFQQRVGDTKQAVSMKDVEEVIEIMGKPETFIGEDEKKEEPVVDDASETHYNKGRSKRVFRDAEDKVLGGVCSGLANYFGFDPLWLRIFFAVMFFGFGSGLLIYILLWIIIPEARTTAEKLEMKGENVNIKNIEKTIKEELDDLKRRYADSHHGGRSFSDFFSRAGSLLLQLLTFLAKAILKIIGGFMIFIGVILLIAFIGTFFGSDALIHINNEGVSHISLPLILNTFFNSSSDITQAQFGLALLIGIPLLMVIYSGIKIIFKIQQKNRILKGVALGLWTVGLIMCIMTVYRISNEFRQKSVQKERMAVVAKPAVLRLDAETNKYSGTSEEEEHENRVELGDWVIISEGDKEINLGFPRLDIVKSDADTFELVIQKIARGVSKKEAYNRAGSISYAVTQTDSGLMFAPHFSMDKMQKWRDQQVKMILRVPVGKTIYLSERMKHIIFDIKNVTNTLDSDMLNRRWIMKEEGLTCVDCDGLKLKKDEEEEVDEEWGSDDWEKDKKDDEEYFKKKHKRSHLKKQKHHEEVAYHVNM